MNKSINKQDLVSSPRIFGGFGLLIILILGFGVLLFKVLFDSFLEPFKVETWNNLMDYLPVLFVVGIELLLIWVFFRENRMVIIQTDQIIFRNVLFSNIYKASPKKYFSGYYLVKETDKYGNEYQAVYLLNNNYIVDRFSSFYYQNFNDLLENWEIPFLGEKKIPFLKKFAIMLFGAKLKINQ